MGWAKYRLLGTRGCAVRQDQHHIHGDAVLEKAFLYNEKMQKNKQKSRQCCVAAFFAKCF